MAEFKQSVLIDRPLAEVFAFVSNLENDPPWTAAVEVRRTSQGPVGVGTTFSGAGPLLGPRP